jgi:FtsH-binding integral membrane protein
MIPDAPMAGGAGADGLQLQERLFAAALGVLAMAAAAGYAWGVMPLAYTVSVGAMPLGLLLAGVILWRRGLKHHLHRYGGLLRLGALWGLVATLAYDLYRPAVKLIFNLPFDPFRVQPIFGHILTGLSPSHPLALILGWGYHLWMGLLLGMIFALLRPRGGALAGLGFIMAIQVLRLAAYPSVLQASWEDPEFLANGVMGMGLWGLVLGAGLRRWGWRYA